MLVWGRRPVLGVPRQMNLAVLADDASVWSDQDRSVEAAGLAFLLRQLSVAEVEADTLRARQLEQRQCLGGRNLRLEVLVDLGLVLHPPAWEESGERKLGKHHELRVARIGLFQNLHQPLHDALAAVSAMDGPELGGGDFQTTGHFFHFTSTDRGLIGRS